MDDYRYDESLAIPGQLAYNQANKLVQTWDQETAFPRSLAPSQIVCRFFVRGFCRRGSSCWFNHDPDILLSNMGYIDGGHRSKETPANHDRAQLVETIKSPDVCSICFELPELYGILESCGHVFCLDCIRSWRSSSSSKEVTNIFAPGPTNSRTCPCCRASSKYVIPSSISPARSENLQGSARILAKEMIQRSYLNRMKEIPCKYFRESSDEAKNQSANKPSCPFANDCHYAHENPSTGQPYQFKASDLRRLRREATKAHKARRSNGVSIAGVFQDIAGLESGRVIHDVTMHPLSE